jgi:hypothetical protein
MCLKNRCGLAEGHYPWDLESKPNMMTNAKIEEVGTDRVVKLNYSRGEHHPGERDGRRL